MENSHLIGQSVTLSPLSNSTKVLQRLGEEVWVRQLEWSPTHTDSCFNVVHGLSGRAVSLQLRDNPDMYIRHHGGMCFVEENDGSQMFEDDSTFIVHSTGLAGGMMSSVSFESINFPGFFISHSADRVQIIQYSDTDDYKQNSSWITKSRAIELYAQM